MNATFPNFLLDDLEWGEHFNTEGAPTMRVHGKDGKLVQQFSPGVPSLDWGLDDVEKVVQQLIEQK